MGKREWKRKAKIVAFCFVVGTLLFPEAELVCPGWSVSVVDGTQAPVGGITVRRLCQDYSVESVGHEDDAITDKRGGVVFHEIRNRVPRLQRWAGNLLNASREGVHASFGIHAHVFAFGNGLEGSAVSNGLVEDWTGSPEHGIAHCRDAVANTGSQSERSERQMTVFSSLALLAAQCSTSRSHKTAQRRVLRYWASSL